ncbi:MAG: amidohydrolase [Flavobacteriales bacterium]|nr:amidohydrolase [Flavobacteriales bacterium]
MNRSHTLSLLIFFLASGILQSCSDPKKEVDTILYDGQIVLVDSAFSVVSAIAMNDGKIVAVGEADDILDEFIGREQYDLKGGVVYPGFIDAHCHFYAYGIDLQELDLKAAISFEDMIQKTVAYAEANNPAYIVGRGWNEEDWESHSTINKFKLDYLFPETPVILQRIDGHAALCNQAALNLAGIDDQTQIEGGIIEKVGGFITGIVVDQAAEMVFSQLPLPSRSQQIEALIAAEKACFRRGLTTVSDAGLPLSTIELIDSLQHLGKLSMRIYAMSNPDMDELHQLYDTGIRNSEKLVLRSVKLYGDGSLGSRGALLKKPYCDQPGHLGLLQHDLSFYRAVMDFCLTKGLQVNTHCIGDSANNILLTEYANRLHGHNNKRWRIEHAQVVDPDDFHFFGDYSIIPSVQPTHATSDMYMAEERLCDADRMKGAYSYKTLYKENGLIAFGTDFPVENIDPLGTYLASTTRMGKKGETFRKEEGLPYQETIRGMTIWAAYANFMDEFTGSLEVGKCADLVVLSGDLEYVTKPGQVHVNGTMVDGKFVYLNGLSPDRKR